MSGLVRTEPLPGETPLLVPGDPYSVVVLLQGYAEPEGVGDAVRADGSVTLVLPQAWGPGKFNSLVAFCLFKPHAHSLPDSTSVIGKNKSDSILDLCLLL